LAHKEFRKLNLSSLKGFLAGAAPLPVKVISELKALRDIPVINIYGLAETCLMGTATPWRGPEKPGTVGLPLPGTDLRIVDAETGTRVLTAGEVGEICFKGPQVMKGCYKKPEESKSALREGWLFTGDIGFLDADGYLTILGRKKDLIMANGCTTYPGEIDEALLTCPKVLDACAIGIPDDSRGETVKAYVVLKPGETADAEEIIDHCRGILTQDKVPQGIEFIDVLPKSAVGEILRVKVRELERKNRGEKDRGPRAVRIIET
jgi:long-chain acyl-CoA synthetase